MWGDVRSQTFGTSLEHLLCFIEIADATRGLHLDPSIHIRDRPPHEANIFGCGTGTALEAGTCFDKGSTGFGSDVAGGDLLFCGEEGGFDDGFDGVWMGCLDGGVDINIDGGKIRGFKGAERDYGIYFSGTVCNGLCGLVGLCFGGAGTEGEANDAADFAVRVALGHAVEDLTDVGAIHTAGLEMR